MSKHLKNSLFVLTIFLIFFLITLVSESVTIFLLFLYNLFLPIILGFGIAFLLYPLMKYLGKYGIKQRWAIMLIYLVIIYLITFFIVNISPIIYEESQKLTARIPDLIAQVDNFLASTFGSIGTVPSVNEIMDGLISRNNVFDYIFSAGRFITLIIIAPLLSIYFLIEYDNIKSCIKEKVKNEKITGYLHDLSAEIIGYFKGVFIVVFILSIATTIGFFVIGLDYPLVFGLIVGLTNIIPFIGPYIGGAIAVLYGLTESITLAIGALIVVMVFQLLEANFLTPYIQSKTIKKKPIYVISAFIIFGSLFGITGMILAVPILSAITLAYKYFKVRDKRNI